MIRKLENFSKQVSLFFWFDSNHLFKPFFMYLLLPLMPLTSIPNSSG